jgi:hypothetical protein
MAARSRGGALTAGLILIALGVIFLIESFHESFSAMHLFARYWPVIPIIIGVRRFYAYIAWQAYPPAPDKTSTEGVNHVA